MAQLTGCPAIAALSSNNMRDAVELPPRKAGYVVGGDNHTSGSGLEAARAFSRFAESDGYPTGLICDSG
jgi:hypothetical protein